jgi:hypothetical protein
MYWIVSPVPSNITPCTGDVGGKKIPPVTMLLVLLLIFVTGRYKGLVSKIHQYMLPVLLLVFMLLDL